MGSEKGGAAEKALEALEWLEETAIHTTDPIAFRDRQQAIAAIRAALRDDPAWLEEMADWCDDEADAVLFGEPRESHRVRARSEADEWKRLAELLRRLSAPVQGGRE